MNRKEQQKYHGVGAHYWWLVGKYRIVMDQISRHISPRGGLRILDIGCGPGYTLDRLRDFGQCVGVDYSPDAARFCQERGYSEVVVADAQALPVADGTFDLVVSLDVMEHLEDDATAAKEVFRVLKPGGLLVMTVPTFMLLWGDHDEMYLHKRRYRLPQIRALVEGAGFQMRKLSHMEPLFFLPLLMYRKWKLRFRQGRRRTDDFIQIPSWLNTLLAHVVGLERYWLRWFGFSFGVNSICICEKPLCGEPSVLKGTPVPQYATPVAAIGVNVDRWSKRVRQSVVSTV